MCDHHTEQVAWCKLCLDEVELVLSERAEQYAALCKLYAHVGSGVQKLMLGKWRNDA